MDLTQTAWLLGAALSVLVALLIVTRLARRMDRARRAINNDPPISLTKALGMSALNLKALNLKALGVTAGETDAEETGGEEKTAKGKKQTSAFATIAGVLAVVGAIAAFASDFINGDVTPVISEIAAGELRGTMLNLRNSDPVVLIVPGSGPVDRNGNSPAGLHTDAYKLLAEGLAEGGIASVRVDKRGMFGSSGAGDPNVASPTAYVDDYRAWIDVIKAERGSRCVWLLGHSEGALMVALAAEGRKDVCGLILVSGMGRKMGDVIRQQLRENPANAAVLDEALRSLDALEAGRRVDPAGMHAALSPLFGAPVQDYLIATLAIDPVEAVRRAKKRTLVVQGTTDLQVSVEDARRLNTAPKTKLQLITGMNHVLKAAPADRAANLATYSNPSLPLAPKLVRRIKDFIKDDD